MVNISIIAFVAFVTISIMLISFVVKALRYDESNNTVPLRVQKKEYQITSQTIGTVSKVMVARGGHVKRGDELAELTNTILDKQILLLEQLSATNGSASIQLVDLKTQKEAQKLYSPTDGVVSEIVTEGEPINTFQKVGTIFSDNSVDLVGRFNLSEYNQVLQNSGVLTIGVERNNSAYTVQFAGTRQIVSKLSNPNADISLVFALTNPEDAINLLQNERVKLRLVAKEKSTKPLDRLVDWYKNNIVSSTSGN